jgi:hypothetical protein
LIPISNVLSRRIRLTPLLGYFKYKSSNVLNDTHLRVFTFFKTERYLLSQSSQLERVYSGKTAGVPRWWLRRCVLPTSLSEHIDVRACGVWPNLVGGQIVFGTIKK